MLQLSFDRLFKRSFINTFSNKLHLFNQAGDDEQTLICRGELLCWRNVTNMWLSPTHSSLFGPLVNSAGVSHEVLSLWGQTGVFVSACWSSGSEQQTLSLQRQAERCWCIFSIKRQEVRSDHVFNDRRELTHWAAHCDGIMTRCERAQVRSCFSVLGFAGCESCCKQQIRWKTTTKLSFNKEQRTKPSVPLFISCCCKRIISSLFHNKIPSVVQSLFLKTLSVMHQKEVLLR